MITGLRRLAAVAYAAIIMFCMHDIAASSIHVTNSVSTPTSCHGQPCQNSNGSRGTTSDNLQRYLASPVYEEYYNNEVEAWLDNRRVQIESSVFISYDSQGVPYQSTEYAYDDFLQSLRAMSVNGVGGGDDSVYFYIGQTDNKGVVHGLVNVAAFLAHAMAISIKYDVCDEFNRDATDGTQKYAVSNSCGQWGLSYQDEVCEGDSAWMTCDVNSDMTIIAASSMSGEKMPPPLECRPKESASDFTGHWDAELGLLSETYPYANRKGVLHNEACCWWGRGVLFTRGPCNFGRVNQFLGRKAAEQGFLNFYDVDICIYPEIICEGHDTRGLRWSVGFFEWADRVETYKDETEGWDYMAELDTFVETGFLDVNRFIDIVSKALPFGCVETACLAEEENVRQERRDNFINLIINVLNLPYLVETTPFPTPPPTNKPTQESTPLPTMPPVMKYNPPTNPPSLPPVKSQSEPPTKLPTEQPTPAPTPVTTSDPTLQPLSPIFTMPESTQTSTTPKPTPQSQPRNVCEGLSSTYLPVNECKEYVQCANGIQVSKQSCAMGLLFDSSISQCNWESFVTCTAPTQSPTMNPTNIPTRQPTGQPLVPLLPTFSPSPKPLVSFPISTEPYPVADQWPTIGMPNEQWPTFGNPSNANSDEQRPTTFGSPSNAIIDIDEVSNSPTNPPNAPPEDFSDLILLPSAGMSLGIKFGSVLSSVGFFGCLWLELI